MFRSLLSAALGADASRTALSYGEFGKPFLPGVPLRFNWSHCSGCAALGVSRSLELGCDVEDAERPASDTDGIAEDCFRKEESAWMRAGADERIRTRRFFSLFTQKEARLKAWGVGLSAPLAGAQARLREPPFADGGLCCLSFGEGGRYIAALCADGGKPVAPLVRRFRLGAY